jgi:hypothetical protein
VASGDSTACSTATITQSATLSAGAENVSSFRSTGKRVWAAIASATTQNTNENSDAR